MGAGIGSGDADESDSSSVLHPWDILDDGYEYDARGGYEGQSRIADGEALCYALRYVVAFILTYIFQDKIINGTLHRRLTLRISESLITLRSQTSSHARSLNFLSSPGVHIPWLTPPELFYASRLATSASLPIRRGTTALLPTSALFPLSPQHRN